MLVAWVLNLIGASFCDVAFVRVMYDKKAWQRSQGCISRFGNTKQKISKRTAKVSRQCTADWTRAHSPDQKGSRGVHSCIQRESIGRNVRCIGHSEKQCSRAPGVFAEQIVFEVDVKWTADKVVGLLSDAMKGVVVLWPQAGLYVQGLPKGPVECLRSRLQLDLSRKTAQP